MIIALIYVSVVAALSLSANSSRADLIETFRKLSPSVGALYAQTDNGSLAYNCTVTVVEKIGTATVVITANHCIGKGQSYLVTFDGRRFHSARVWKLPPEEIDPQKYPRLPGRAYTDMGLFLIDEVLNIPTIARSTRNRVEPGQKVINIAYPLGISKVRYEGIISGRFDRPGADQNGYLLLQIFGAPGSSGSAIIDAETQTIVGIMVGARQSIVGLPVIFATPIEYEQNLMEIPASGSLKAGAK